MQEEENKFHITFRKPPEGMDETGYMKIQLSIYRFSLEEGKVPSDEDINSIMDFVDFKWYDKKNHVRSSYQKRKEKLAMELIDKFPEEIEY